ncbi:MAG TPA: hypothetical protein VLW55_07975 [Burkholderiaceae bacterium]|nr:hypothetical protein [Burkholderiaceae bacterium]
MLRAIAALMSVLLLGAAAPLAAQGSDTGVQVRRPHLLLVPESMSVMPLYQTAGRP